LPDLPPKQTLDWNWNNIALLGTAYALGQLGVQLGVTLLQLFTTRTAPMPAEVAQRPDPLSWLPAGLLSAAVPRVRLELPTLGRPCLFVELQYLGHVLYYQPRERLLLWRVVPGTSLALLSAEYVDAVAEQTPYQPARPLADARWTTPGWEELPSGSSPLELNGGGIRPALGQPKNVG
jgi:hypothetical protein